MTPSAQWLAGSPKEYDVTHPLVNSKFHNTRSVFAPGLRIKMNIVPMFLNIFIPWGVFIFACGITSSYMSYAHAHVVVILLALMFAIWLGLAVMAVWARVNDPDPTWFTYLAIAVGAALLIGAVAGHGIFSDFAEPYFKIRDLKSITDIDASSIPGENVMDAGIIRFGAGNHLDPLRSWHFVHRTTYCVAPIITNSSRPRGLSYDFWAVGKDCCSVSASDFRCGSWGSIAAQGGWRVMDESDLIYYHLAVQQAESLYNINARNPIFLNWSQNPAAEVSRWQQQAFQSFLMMAAFAFVFSFFFTAMASCRFAWLGRGASVYQAQYTNDPGMDYDGYRSKAFFA